MIVFLILGAAVVAVFLAVHLRWSPAVLLVSSLAFARPGVFGPWAHDIGMLLSLLAAVLSLGVRDSPSHVRGRLARGVFWATLTYVLVIAQVGLAVGGDWTIYLNAGISTLVPVFCWVAVLRRRDEARRVMVVFLFVAVALSASYVVSILAVTLGSAAVVYQLPARAGGAAEMLLPLSPVLGEVQIASVVLPRFTGLAQEPGMWALFLGVSFFFTDALGRYALAGRVVILAGIVGTFSTAGFAAMVMVLIWHNLLRGGHSLVRRLVGVCVAAGGAWLAYSSPVVGIASKGDVNAESLAVREDATRRGIEALLHSPLQGAGADTPFAAINLVASVAPFGVWVLLASTLMIWMPYCISPRPAALSSSLIFVTFILMTSQPILTNSGVIAMVFLAHAQLAKPEKSARIDESGDPDGVEV